MSIVLWGCAPQKTDSDATDPEEMEPPTTDLTYCDASVIIEDKCVRCHAEGGDVLTPFFFDSYEDVEVRVALIEWAIEEGVMPMVRHDVTPPVEPLTSVEKELLLEWLAAGAPEGDGACD